MTTSAPFPSLAALENAAEFQPRHIGIDAADEAHMLSVIGEASRRALIDGIAKDIVDLTTEYGWTGGPYYTPAMSTALTDAVNRIVVEGADAKSELSAAQSTMQGMLDTLQ